jgi:disulfide bond formation protein DsbB
MKLSMSPDVARFLNLIGMVAMICVLLGAYTYQFTYRELPCTLCLLQRVAMTAVAIGAAMNVVLGPDPRHYGVCLVSAVFGGAVSIRQTMLHINPFFDTNTGIPTLDGSANPAFGHAVMGLHLYVWGIILFGTVILSVGAIQLFSGQFDHAGEKPDPLRGLVLVTVGLLIAVASLATVTTFMECGLGDCPNDGSWNWWILR